jgi:hypothetical protein
MTVLQWIMMVPHAMGGEALIGGLSMVLGESNYGRWTGMGNFFLDSFSSVELRAIAADWTQVIDTWNGGEEMTKNYHNCDNRVRKLP